MVIIRNYSNFLKSFNSKKFKDLWPAQGDILEKYVKSKFMEKSDVAIELPTGGGKTLIALLIAEAWRRENKKVAILSANKTLARQMKRETEQLGIPAVLMEGKGIDIPASDKRAYQRTNKIALMNYWVYFNQNPVVDNADLLIMDDAHLAEHCLHSLWSVEISRNEHNNLFIDLITELINHFPEYAILQDALEGNSSSILATELLSFIEQINISDRFREIIDSSPSLELDRSLRYSWKRMRNSLNEVNIYLSLNSIWFRPCVYPLINNSQYRDATQRLYMSATIGEPSDLSRRLGIKKIEKIPVPQKFSETTIGRRLIVMNRIEDEDLPERLQVAIIAALRKCPKSVWLCTSKAEAEKYKQVISEWLNESGLIGHPTWVLSNLGNEIDSFKKAKAGHLFVGGRFDGMDFHDNECRLVILTTLPRAINIQEEFFCGHLRDAGFMKRRLNHRIIQALGRCNRSKDDYAIYI
ncbi:MAG TPA: DEAD/DEAH box helicase, partial [bacterium]|nr:DEAD/DEAH box helicase [bacterium]